MKSINKFLPVVNKDNKVLEVLSMDLENSEKTALIMAWEDLEKDQVT